MPWPRRVTHLLWAASVVLLVLRSWPCATSVTPPGRGSSGGRSWPPGCRSPRATWRSATTRQLGRPVAHRRRHEHPPADGARQLGRRPGRATERPRGSAELLNLTQGIWMGWFLPFAMVLLLFPDGRPIDRRARRTAVALPASVLAFDLFLAVAPGPLMPPLDDWPRPFGEHWVGYGAIPALVVFYACLRPGRPRDAAPLPRRDRRARHGPGCGGCSSRASPCRQRSSCAGWATCSPGRPSWRSAGSSR